MGIESWPPEEILRIARTSGKALEVRCAETFLSGGWSARLGSYFADGALDVPRELDVLAEKARPLPSGNSVRVGIRAVISCRDFPGDRSPLTYSVTTKAIPSFTPRVIAEHRVPWAFDGMEFSYGPLPKYEALCAKLLTQLTGGGERRHIVAFDMLQRKEPSKRTGSDQAVVVEFSRMSDGDRSVFKAVDSAIKAAQYWGRQEQQDGEFFATITVPILLLGGSFWDVCIDGGEAAEPRFACNGWMANLFPRVGGPGPARELTTLVWSVEQVGRLVEALDRAFAFFWVEIDKDYKSSIAGRG